MAARNIVPALGIMRPEGREETLSKLVEEGKKRLSL